MNQELSNIFQAQFQQPAQLEVFAAGRVNLIGEHTDYNDGLVLPTAIPQKATLQLSSRTDGKQAVRLYSVQMNQQREYDLGFLDNALANVLLSGTDSFVFKLSRCGPHPEVVEERVVLLRDQGTYGLICRKAR